MRGSGEAVVDVDGVAFRTERPDCLISESRIVISDLLRSRL